MRIRLNQFYLVEYMNRIIKDFFFFQCRAKSRFKINDNERFKKNGSPVKSLKKPVMSLFYRKDDIYFFITDIGCYCSNLKPSAWDMFSEICILTLNLLKTQLLGFQVGIFREFDEKYFCRIVGFAPYGYFHFRRIIKKSRFRKKIDFKLEQLIIRGSSDPKCSLSPNHPAPPDNLLACCLPFKCKRPLRSKVSYSISQGMKRKKGIGEGSQPLTHSR